MKLVEKNSKEQKKKKKKKTFMLIDLMIPIVSGTIFLLVLFFILIPSITNSQDALAEIEDVRDQQEILKRNLDIVESLNFVSMQKDLSNARKVLPRRLEVAQFAYYIDSLASEKGLAFRELRAGDVAVSEEEISLLDVKGIRVPMAYTGDYEPILEFFNELQLVSPYVISFGHRVDLRKSGTEEEDDVRWNLEINVTGYHVEEDEDFEHEINYSLPIRPYDLDLDMIAEFEDRVERLIE